MRERESWPDTTEYSNIDRLAINHAAKTEQNDEENEWTSANSIKFIDSSDLW